MVCLKKLCRKQWSLPIQQRGGESEVVGEGGETARQLSPATAQSRAIVHGYQPNLHWCKNISTYICINICIYMYAHRVTGVRSRRSCTLTLVFTLEYVRINTLHYSMYICILYNIYCENCLYRRVKNSVQWPIAVILLSVLLFICILRRS